MSVAPTNYITTIPPPSWIPSDAPTLYSGNPVYWSGIASSSNGQNMAAVSENGYIYTSTNGAKNWTQRYNVLGTFFTSIASSSNGQILYATAPNISTPGGVFVSTNGGVNWTTFSSLPLNDWIEVTCDGTGQFVAVSGWYLFSPPIINGVYYSTNYGSSFTYVNPSNPPVFLRFGSITSNTSSGQFLAVVATSTNGTAGGIYYSNDYGSNWSQSNAPLSINDSTYSNVWTSIDCDSTGQYMAATYGGTTNPYFGVWLSTNYGANWSQSSLIQNNLASIASSSNGTILITCSFGGGIWISTNSGGSWTGISSLIGRSITINYSGTLSAVGTSGIYYYNNYSIYGTQDLANLFQALPSGVTPAPITNYTVPTLGDLNNVFAPISIGTSISSNTRYTVSNTDLSSIFAAKIFTTSPAGIYSSSYSGGYYTIALTGSGTITFYQSLTGIQVVVVGGGGGGGDNTGTGDFGNTTCGGGGGAGGQTVNTNTNITLNTPYSFTIGAGGAGGAGGGQTGGTTTFNSINAIGGTGGNPVSNPTGSLPGGGSGGVGGGGSGGNGGTVSGGVPSVNGFSGSNISIGLNSYYFGGGGAGGSYNAQTNGANTTKGGLGGGGGSGGGTLSNNNTSWISPTGTPNYPQGYDQPNYDILPPFYGWPSTGGGGAGGNGNGNFIYRSGGTGASGVVIITFQYP